MIKKAYDKRVTFTSPILTLIIFFLFIFTVGCESEIDNRHRQKKLLDAPDLVNKYLVEGYFCNKIINEKHKSYVLERANIILQSNEHQVFKCSKKEYGTIFSHPFSAIIYKVVIITNKRNSVISIGYYSDEKFL